jgi:hypothetical protein
MPIPQALSFDVYGRFVVEVVRSGGRWTAYYVGEGKKSLADHLDVLFHEYAMPGKNVNRIAS